MYVFIRKCVYFLVYAYVYTCILRLFSGVLFFFEQLQMHVFVRVLIFLYVCVCMYVCIYIYIYIMCGFFWRTVSSYCKCVLSCICDSVMHVCCVRVCFYVNVCNQVCVAE